MTFRIQKSFESESVLFRLTGRIQGEQIPDLQALLESESSGHSVVLDLACVKLVDRQAVQFLAQAEAAGTKLRNCAAYIKQWITQETNATAT
jgi:anti-anti-sigma regulatory factor